MSDIVHLACDSAVYQSRCLYVRGINRISTIESLRSHFDRIGSVESLKFSESPRQGFCWVTFYSREVADQALRELHHSNLNGSVITVRYELGIKQSKDLDNLSVTSSVCVPRNIMYDYDGRCSKKLKKTSKINVSYTGRGILVDGTEYPSPQGTYLMRLLKLCNSTAIGNRQPLMDALLDARRGNKHAKELSESMAMVNAVQRLEELTGTDWRSVDRPINVYALADGMMPSTSITMCLFYPHWNYTSIDPILDYDVSALGLFSSRITCVKALSQNFVIPLTAASKIEGIGYVGLEDIPCYNDDDPLAARMPNSNGDELNPISISDIFVDSVPVREGSGSPINIVIACHSHAPLQEFWDRVPVPKFCVAMPCCGKTWSHLEQTPLHVYDDYEVFSPKRKIFLYHTDSN